MLTKRRIVAAKIEAVEGTAETLANADCGILAIDPKVEVDITMHPRTPAKASIGNLASLPGSQMAKISFKVEIKGAGSAYSSSVQPALGKYLRACGFAETIDTTLGAEKATYAPASSGAPSLTLGSYEAGDGGDDVIKSIIGARGNAKLSSKAGEPVYIEFEFTGVWNGLTDGALLTPTYESTLPPVFLSAGFTVASYAAVMSAFDIDMANELALRESANKAAGYLSSLITGRKPAGSIDPEMVVAATHDWYGKWKAGTTGALNIGAIGATQYNKFTITAPKLQYTKVADGDREGVATADTNFELAENTGDDEIVIEFS